MPTTGNHSDAWLKDRARDVPPRLWPKPPRGKKWAPGRNFPACHACRRVYEFDAFEDGACTRCHVRMDDNPNVAKWYATHVCKCGHLVSSHEDELSYCWQCIDLDDATATAPAHHRWPAGRLVKA